MKTPVCKIYTNIIREIYIKISIYTLVIIIHQSMLYELLSNLIGLLLLYYDFILH